MILDLAVNQNELVGSALFILLASTHLLKILAHTHTHTHTHRATHHSGMTVSPLVFEDV